MNTNEEVSSLALCYAPGDVSITISEGRPEEKEWTSDTKKAALGLGEIGAVANALHLRRTVSLGNEDREQAAVHCVPDLLDQSYARVDPSVLLDVIARVEEMKRPVKIVDVLGVNVLRLPRDICSLPIFIGLPKTIVARDLGINLRLHKRPIEKQVVVECIDVFEVAQKGLARAVRITSDLIGAVWMAPSNRPYQDLLESFCIRPHLFRDLATIGGIETEES